MQQGIGKVVAPGLHAIKLVIQLKREPGKRMPVGGISMGDCPHGRAHGQAVLDVRVVDNVLRVINIGEGMTVYRRVDCHRGDGEQCCRKRSIGEAPGDSFTLHQRDGFPDGGVHRQ